MAEFSSYVDEDMPPECVISIDSASNMKGSRTRIILEGPDDILVEQVLKFYLPANNNQVEYEPLIVGMVLVLEIRSFILKAKNDF